MTHLKHWSGYQVLEAMVAVSLATLTDLKTALAAMLALVMVDVLTGVAAAYRRHEAIRSRRYFEGLVHKLLSVALIGVVWGFERYFGGEGYPFASWLAYLIALGELISIAENLETLGVPMMGALLNKLKEARDDHLSERNRPE